MFANAEAINPGEDDTPVFRQICEQLGQWFLLGLPWRRWCWSQGVLCSHSKMIESPGGTGGHLRSWRSGRTCKYGCETQQIMGMLMCGGATVGR